MAISGKITISVTNRTLKQLEELKKEYEESTSAMVRKCIDNEHKKLNNQEQQKC